MTDPIKLSDIVSEFFIEKNLPFYLKPNRMDPRIQSIRKTEWPLDYCTNAKTNIGFVSDRRGQVCWGIFGETTLWLDARDPNFFKKLHELLLHV